MNMLPTVQGVSYGRVSTFEQAFNNDGSIKEDASPAVQKIRCSDHVVRLNNNPNRKFNYQLIDHFSDDGFSGKNTKRPSFKKVEDLIKNGKIKFVVATELSRLSRNTQDFLDFVSTCEKYKVDLFIIGFDLDTSSPMGKVFLTLLVALAQFERETTSERVRNNAKSRLLTDGKINGASEVLGLDKDPSRKGHFIKNEEELKRLNEILEIFIATSSKVETLREIKKKGIKWKGNEEFTKHKLYALFSCVKDRYRGIWPVDKKNGLIDQFVKLPHGPLVDLNILDQVQNKLEEVAVKKRKPGKNYLYLLTSLLVHEDGSKFTGQPAKARQYRYYYNPTNKLRISCEEIDMLILKRLAEYIANDQILSKLVEEAVNNRSQKITALKKRQREVIEISKKIDESLNEIICKQEFTFGTSGSEIKSVLEDQILTQNAKKKEFQAELERLGASLDELSRPVSLDNIRKLVQDILVKKDDQKSHRRTLLEAVFEKIVIKSSNVIELHFYGDIFTGKSIGERNILIGEKNKATSLSCGLNGGSTGT